MADNLELKALLKILENQKKISKSLDELIEAMNMLIEIMGNQQQHKKRRK